MAERELIYRTKVINDPASAAALKELGALASAVYKSMGGVTSAANGAVVAGARLANLQAQTAKAAAGAEKERAAATLYLAKATTEAARADLIRLQASGKVSDADRKAAATAKALAVAEKAAAQERIAVRQAVAEAQKEQLAMEKAERKAIAEAQREQARIEQREQQQSAAMARRRAVEGQRAGQEAAGAVGKQVKAQKDLVEATEGVIGGAATIGRGFVMAGLASEESMEQVVGVLLQVQAVMDLAKGGAAIYFGIVKGVRAYEMATKSAVVAETALAAARSRTGAVGVGGAAAGAAKGIGGAAASAGGLAGGVGVGGAALGLLLNPVTLAIAAVVLAFASVAAVFYYFSPKFRSAFGETLDALFDYRVKIREATEEVSFTGKQLQRAERERDSRVFATNQEFQESGRLNSLRLGRDAFGRSDSEANLGARASNQVGLLDIDRRIKRNTDRDLAVPLEKERERLLEEGKRIDEERLRITKEKAREEKHSAEETLKSRKQEADTARDMASKARDRLKSAEERLAGLDPLAARRVAEAAKVASRGGELTGRQADSLRGLGVADDAISRTDKKRVAELGLSSVLDPLRKDVAASDAAVRAADLRVKNAVNAIDQVLAEGSEALVKGIGESMKKFTEDLIFQVERRMEAERKEAGRSSAKAGAERRTSAS